MHAVCKTSNLPKAADKFAKCNCQALMYLHCLMSCVEGWRSGMSLGLCTGQAAWFLLEGARPTPKLLLQQDQSNLLYQSPAASLHFLI